MISLRSLNALGLVLSILSGLLLSSQSVESSAQSTPVAPHLHRPNETTREPLIDSPELIGIWHGAGITLTLDAQSIVTLKQSDVYALMIITDKASQGSSATQEVLRGLWWENRAQHLRTLCLFFDLTSRCLPISISRLNPSSLIVRVGHQTQVTLKRMSRYPSQSSPRSTSEH